MITDVPQQIDFHNEGLVLLNLAWDEMRRIDEAIQYFLAFPEIEESASDDAAAARYVAEDRSYREELREGLVRSIQRPLGVCRTLAAQAAEFLLKARIAAVSPFLLIKDEPSRFPGTDKAFSEFQTIDSRDLIRVYHTVGKDRLDDRFVDLFHKLRESRNLYVHGIVPPDDVTLDHVCDDLLRTLLTVADFLAAEGWRAVRVWYLQNYDAGTILSHAELMQDQVVHEMAWIVKRLKPAECERFLGFNRRKGRNYLCPSCYFGEYDSIPEARLAKLRDDEVYCIACDTSYQIERRKCPERGCRGDVISVWDAEFCLTCGVELDPPQAASSSLGSGLLVAYEEK